MGSVYYAKHVKRDDAADLRVIYCTWGEYNTPSRVVPGSSLRTGSDPCEAHGQTRNGGFNLNSYQSLDTSCLEAIAPTSVNMAAFSFCNEHRR